MDQRTSETWLFTAHAPDAEQVYLVVDSAISPSRWIKMRRDETRPGAWQSAAQFTPGRCRARYFTVEDGAYLNCGDVGLESQRTSAQHEGHDLAASA